MRPITPCDIAYRFLFSKVSKNYMADDSDVIPLDSNVEQKTQAPPIIHLTHSKQAITVSHSPLKLESSRLISKAWTQGDTLDPSSALLCIVFGDRSTAKLLHQNGLDRQW